MRIDKSNTPYKLASDVAGIIKTLRITPHGVTKISLFGAHMGRTPNIPLSNIAKTSSPNNLNWDNAEHACLDQKYLTLPPLPAEIMHDLQRWSEDEASANRRSQMPADIQCTSKPPTQKTPGAQSKKSIEIIRDKLNSRYKGIQEKIDKNTKKQLDQVARKTIRVATKV